MRGGGPWTCRGRRGPSASGQRGSRRPPAPGWTAGCTPRPDPVGKRLGGISVPAACRPALSPVASPSPVFLTSRRKSPRPQDPTPPDPPRYYSMRQPPLLDRTGSSSGTPVGPRRASGRRRSENSRFRWPAKASRANAFLERSFLPCFSFSLSLCRPFFLPLLFCQNVCCWRFCCLPCAGLWKVERVKGGDRVALHAEREGEAQIM